MPFSTLDIRKIAEEIDEIKELIKILADRILSDEEKDIIKQKFPEYFK